MVEREVEVETTAEPWRLNTCLEWASFLGLRILEWWVWWRRNGSGERVTRWSCQYLVRNRVTYLWIRSTIFQVRNHLWQLDHRANNGIGTKTKVTIAFGGAAIFKLSEGTIPVLTIGSIKVNHIFPTNLSSEQGSLIPVGAYRSTCFTCCGSIGLKIVHEFGKSYLVAILRSCGGISILELGLDEVSHPSCCCRHTPCVFKCLVVRQQVVGINFRSAVQSLWIDTIRLNTSGGEGGSVSFSVVVVLGVVNAKTCLEIQTVININLTTHRSKHTVGALLGIIHTCKPVWIVLALLQVCPVLHRTIECQISGGKLVNTTILLYVCRNVLRHPCTIITIVMVAIVVHVQVAWRCVHVVHRVHHRTTTRAVVGNGLDIVDSGIDM